MFLNSILDGVKESVENKKAPNGIPKVSQTGVTDGLWVSCNCQLLACLIWDIYNLEILLT